jgi:hypothetical protein
VIETALVAGAAAGTKDTASTAVHDRGDVAQRAVTGLPKPKARSR